MRFQKCPSASGDVSPDAPFFYSTLICSVDVSTECILLCISGTYWNTFRARPSLLPHSSLFIFLLHLLPSLKIPKKSISTKPYFFHSSSTQSINYNDQHTPNHPYFNIIGKFSSFRVFELFSSLLRNRLNIDF